jgi:molybdate transport system ATP-binding protein
MSLDIHIRHTKGSFELAFEARLPSTGITAIYGPSGSGKTSLLRCIAGLELCEGEISFNEHAWLNKAQRIPCEKRNIAYLFQEGLLFPHLSVRENICFGRTVDQAALLSLSERLGIEHRLNAMPDTLSGGEKQRVCLCRALIAKPDLILMDEPLSALDSESKKKLLEEIRTLSTEHKTPVLYVSHAIREISAIADHVVQIENGALSRHGRIDEMLSQPKFEFNEGDARSVILRGKVCENLDEWQLIRVQLNEPNSTPITLTASGEQLGQALRLQIAAKDVSISMTKHCEQSVMNILPCIVSGIHSMPHEAHALVELNFGSQTLLAQITRKSLAALGIEASMHVWAQIKAVAVLD